MYKMTTVIKKNDMATNIFHNFNINYTTTKMAIKINASK